MLESKAKPNSSSAGSSTQSISAQTKAEVGGSQDPTPSSKSNENITPGGLVVYQGDKLIFRSTTDNQKKNSAEVLTPNRPQILSRVDPIYPEQVRQQKIQGEVVLNILVATDGSVKQVHAVSGDNELAKAASDALRQWKFKPYIKGSRAVEFETEITVNFKLPPDSNDEN